MCAGCMITDAFPVEKGFAQRVGVGAVTEQVGLSELRRGPRVAAPLHLVQDARVGCRQSQHASAAETPETGAEPLGSCLDRHTGGSCERRKHETRLPVLLGLTELQMRSHVLAGPSVRPGGAPHVFWSAVSPQSPLDWAGKEPLVPPSREVGLGLLHRPRLPLPFSVAPRRAGGRRVSQSL